MALWTPAKVGSASYLPSISVLPPVFLSYLKASFYKQSLIDFFFFWHFHLLSLYCCPKNHVPGLCDFLSVEFWAWKLSCTSCDSNKFRERKSSGFSFRLYFALKWLVKVALSCWGRRKKKEMKGSLKLRGPVGISSSFL